MSLIKKTSFLTLAGIILLQSGFAFGFSRLDRFYFLDSEGGSVAELECHSLTYADDMALRKIAGRGEELTVDSLVIKTKTLSVVIKGTEALVLDLEKNRCNVIKEY